MSAEEAQNDETVTVAESLELVTPTSLEAMETAGINVAIATAKKYPRDIAQSIKTCRELALRNPKIAATCNYAVPRGGKKLVGPSVHFARIVLYSWRNCTALARVIGCDRANAHLQGVMHDLESNTRIGMEMDWPVQAPHVDSPERWKDQMNLAKRAGSAVALRTAIFQVIPMVLFDDIAEEAKLVALGKGKTFAEQRANAIGQCKELGITQPMIYKALEVGGLESITTDDLIWLHAVLQSIRDHAMSKEEIFGREKEIPVKARAPRSRNQGGRFAPEGEHEESQKVESAASGQKQALEQMPLPGTATDLAEKLTRRLGEEQIPIEDFLGWLRSMGVIGLKVTGLSEVPLAALEDSLANWTDNIAGYAIWKEKQINEEAQLAAPERAEKA